MGDGPPAAPARRERRDAGAPGIASAPAYEDAADVVVDTEGRTVDEVAARVLEELAVVERDRRDSRRPYDVVVGPGALAVIDDVLGDRRQVVVVTQQGILDALGEQLPWPHVVIGDGEDAKSLDTVELLCREFAQRGLLRGDAVVALGGGVVGDTAGFAAAVYHRGIAVVQAPTTLLAQVDAAIGGKTAVNLPEGKNLVGAFHQPIAVLADVEPLARCRTRIPRRARRGRQNAR